MSDRLALSNAIEDAGIERAKAERMASVIVDMIREQSATKSDVQSSEARLRSEIAAVRADLALVEHRLLTRLGGVVVVAVGVLFAALHYWPPGHG